MAGVSTDPGLFFFRPAIVRAFTYLEHSMMDGNGEQLQHLQDMGTGGLMSC